MRKIKKLIPLLLTLVLTLGLAKTDAFAKGPLDEIVNYTITIDVNDDATLNMLYHVDWKVLDSKSEGPLSWVKIGVPNSHTLGYEALSDTVSSIGPYDNKYMRIDLDKDYYEGEIASFDFVIRQDYMYSMNSPQDGMSQYTFTPGWFDDIEVDNLVIKWKMDKADSWNPAGLIEDDYLVWTTSLGAGERYTVSVMYTNDAFEFIEYSGSDDYYEDDDDTDGSTAGVLFLLFIASICIIVSKNSRKYKNGSGFGETKTVKKVTRTLIKYYPTCPGCGATRTEGQEKCEYCGRSFVESEEVVEEAAIKDPSKYSDEGTFRYLDSPNTYIRVHVTHVPAPRPSCAHSSCACASHCACACACACAGGGRAGCSTKDFYNTGLKLKQLEKNKK